ncbi:MAG: outer membrane beta-barrel protein [Bacteroidetes bacterium]|nr:outer membrane beta-barrel protein [Bacteroidota bacterium]
MLRLKTIIFLLLFLFSFKKNIAQNFKSKVCGGINFSQVDGDKYAGYNKIGSKVGFTFYREFEKNKNLGFELNYSSKGSRKKVTEEDPSIFKLRINYICLPVFIDFKNVLKGYEKIILKIGISPNILINSKTDFGFGWQKNNLKPMELSSIVGILYQINSKSELALIHENSILSIGNSYADAQYFLLFHRGLFNRLVSFVTYYRF